MATGDVSAPINADGWSVNLTTDGFTSGATYDFDWRAQIPGAFTSGTFTNGETVTQNGTNDTAIVVGNQSSGAFLLVKTVTLTGTKANGLYLQPQAAASTASNGQWVGQSSAAVFTPKGGASVSVPGPNTPFYTVVRQGYDNTGSLGTVTDTVYLTTPVLVPYSTFTINITGGSGTFTDGETVTQATSGATGIVVGNQSATNAKLRMRAVTGTFDNSHGLTGGTSGATATSTSVKTDAVLPAVDEIVSSTQLITRVALSEYIHGSDNTPSNATHSGTAPTLTIPAGAIVNSGGGAQSSNARSAVTQTNNSTVNYPNCIAQFLTSPYKLLSGAFTVECQAFNKFGRSGQPVAAVKFTFTDGTVTRSQTITGMSKSTDDGLPVYACTDNASNFTQGADVVCRVQVYPWVGNASNGLLDSNANAYMNTGMNFASLPVGLCDKNGTYGIPYAAVSPSGTSGGVVSATQATAEATPYATMAQALAGIKTFNNANNGRNTVDGGTIVLLGNGLAFGDGGTTQSNTHVEVIIKPGTGFTSATAGFDGPNLSGRYAPAICRLLGVNNIASSGSNQQFFWCHNTSPVVLENCTITGAGAGTAITSNDTDGKAAFIAKNCAFSGYTSGISGGNDHIALYVRGGSVRDVASGSYAFTNQRALCGVTVTDNSGFDGVSVKASPPAWTDNGNTIFSYNICDGLTGTGASGGAFYDNAGHAVTDLAMVSNLVTRKGVSSSTIVEMSGATITNFMAWHNSFCGQRINTEGMLSSPFTDFVYLHNSLKFNSFYYNGTHNQLDAHSPVTGSNGATTGQWPYTQYCVGWYGNNREIRDTEQFSFDGPYSTSQTVAGYTNDKSLTGIVTIAVNSGTWSGTFQDGEVVYQTTTGAIGYCSGAQSSGSTLTIYSYNQNAAANNSANWNGATSGAHVTPTAVPATGATGGNYVPATSSTLASRVKSGFAVLAFDLAGTAIPTDGTGYSGAYQPVAGPSPSSGVHGKSIFLPGPTIRSRGFNVVRTLI